MAEETNQDRTRTCKRCQAVVEEVYDNLCEECYDNEYSGLYGVEVV